MFGLSRFRSRILHYIEEHKGEVAKLLAPFNLEDSGVVDFFEDALGKEDGSTVGSLERANDAFADAPELNNLLSRELRRLMNEAVDLDVVAQVVAMRVFAGVLVAAMGGERGFDPSKAKTLSEDIRSMKKNANQRVVSLAGILDVLTKRARERIRDLAGIGTDLDNLLELVYGVKRDGNGGAEQFKATGPRELILEYGLRGELPERILAQFSGIVTYSMSILTMVSGSGNPEFQVYVDQLNKLLGTLGEGTQATIFSQRLSRLLVRRSKLKDELEAAWAKLVETAAAQGIELGSAGSELRRLAADPPFDAAKGPGNGIGGEHGADVVPTFTSSLPSACRAPRLLPDTKKVEQLLLGIHQQNQELSLVLRDFGSFIGDLVDKVNRITAELFARGFKARLPVQDVEECEAAGIHLKNIVDSSETGRFQVDDYYFDQKIKMIRAYDDIVGKVLKSLETRVREEEVVLHGEPGVLGGVLRRFREVSTRWQAEGVLDGASEEVLLTIRLLASATAIWSRLHVELGRLNDYLGNVPLNRVFLEGDESVGVILRKMARLAGRLESLDSLAGVLKAISGHLRGVNPSFPFIFAEDVGYVRDPAKFRGFLEGVPGDLKRQAAQRVITRDDLDRKTRSLEEALELIGELEAFPAKKRNLLLPIKKKP
ncbi:MAG: hypothetical protein ACTSU5_01140 [Promethearchaeota archaeon]